MSMLKLIIKEIVYRRISSIIIFFTVILAATVSVAIFTLSRASEDETRKIMREQGLNLYIFPKGTDLLDMFAVSSNLTFPENYVDVLAESKTFDAVRHLTGILQVKMNDWKDPNGSTHRIVLSGYKDEAMQRFLAPQETMHFDVEKGTVQVGKLLSDNIPEGSQFVIRGVDGKNYTYEIAKRFEEGRGMLDQGVSFNLEDLQQVLGLPDKINKIEALGCVCADGRIQNARKQVQEVFPDLEVTELASIADARENQRLMMNKYGSFIIPFILITSLIITGLLFYQNVRARRHEIGLLRAIGNPVRNILFMILAKAFIISIFGSVAGFFLGNAVAEYFGKEIFQYTAMNIKPVWSLFWAVIAIFPVLWMLASWIPALVASGIDAAKILNEE